MRIHADSADAADFFGDLLDSTDSFPSRMLKKGQQLKKFTKDTKGTSPEGLPALLVLQRSGGDPFAEGITS